MARYLTAKTAAPLCPWFYSSCGAVDAYATPGSNPTIPPHVGLVICKDRLAPVDGLSLTKDVARSAPGASEPGRCVWVKRNGKDPAEDFICEPFRQHVLVGDLAERQGRRYLR